MHWNDYRADAPQDSEQWAMSDRGWLFLDPHEHPDYESLHWRDDVPLCVGNYLHYEDRGYHAVAYVFRSTVAGFPNQRLSMPEHWYTTAQEARAAVVRQVLAALRPIEGIQAAL
jgi:hypothetical protein